MIDNGIKPVYVFDGKVEIPFLRQLPIGWLSFFCGGFFVLICLSVFFSKV
jgi:hypothetical protein